MVDVGRGPRVLGSLQFGKLENVGNVPARCSRADPKIFREPTCCVGKFQGRRLEQDRENAIISFRRCTSLVPDFAPLHIVIFRIPQIPQTALARFK